MDKTELKFQGRIKSLILIAILNIASAIEILSYQLPLYKHGKRANAVVNQKL